MCAGYLEEGCLTSMGGGFSSGGGGRDEVVEVSL